MNPATDSRTERITLAGGCFWCLDAAYRRLRGVRAVECGYSNGHVPQPSYAQVCTGRTGHAEVVRVEFDPAEIRLDDLLDVFFAIHDPTSLNRQGADVGPQYRSGIYTHSAEQDAAVRAYVQRLASSGVFDRPLVTEIAPETNYSPAEAEHQNYFDRNPHQGYCAVVIAPKLDKLQQRHRALLRDGA